MGDEKHFLDYTEKRFNSKFFINTTKTKAYFTRQLIFTVLSANENQRKQQQK